MVIGPVGLGIKNHCSGEGQQQFRGQSVDSQEAVVSQAVKSDEGVKYGHESCGTRNQEPAAIYSSCPVDS
jgi:hypothetical protein